MAIHWRQGNKQNQDPALRDLTVLLSVELHQELTAMWQK